MQVSALELRPGTLVSYEGRMASVVWWNILRNDRRAFVQLRIKDIENGRMTELKEHTDSKWEVLDKEELDLTHSYRDGLEEVFYTESGEEVRCPAVACEDALKWPADTYKGFYVAGKLVALSAPRFSVLTIKETAPPMKGGGSGTKEAVLENDVKVKVNLLCDVGDKVRIETETLEFRERVQG